MPHNQPLPLISKVPLRNKWWKKLDSAEVHWENGADRWKWITGSKEYENIAHLPNGGNPHRRA